MHQLFQAILTLFIAFLLSCSNQSSQQNYVDKLFSNQTKHVHIEIDYMQNSMPNIIDENTGEYLFQILNYNLDQVFKHSKSLLIPMTASDLNLISPQNKNYSREDIELLAMQNRDTQAWQNDVASIYVLWLDGYFKNEQGNVESQILGLSISGQSMVAVFKPAVELGSSSFPQYQGYAEQIVMSHEIGHVIGLVNHGIPNVGLHLDTDEQHGTTHCSNSGCVMFWQNDAKKHEIAAHAAQYGNFNVVLFGQDCLLDASSFLNI